MCEIMHENVIRILIVCNFTKYAAVKSPSIFGISEFITIYLLQFVFDENQNIYLQNFEGLTEYL